MCGKTSLQHALAGMSTCINKHRQAGRQACMRPLLPRRLCCLSDVFSVLCSAPPTFVYYICIYIYTLCHLSLPLPHGSLSPYNTCVFHVSCFMQRVKDHSEEHDHADGQADSSELAMAGNGNGNGYCNTLSPISCTLSFLLCFFLPSSTCLLKFSWYPRMFVYPHAHAYPVPLILLAIACLYLDSPHNVISCFVYFYLLLLWVAVFCFFMFTIYAIFATLLVLLRDKIGTEASAASARERDRDRESAGDSDCGSDVEESACF